MKKRIIVGTMAASVLFLIWWIFSGSILSEASFKAGWRRVESGMNEAAVQRTLGRPTRTSHTGFKGAGDKYVTRWEYDRGDSTYCVDYDYFGARGVPLVFRTEVLPLVRRWPSWWPWGRARVMC